MRRPWWPTLLLSGLIVSLALGASEQEELERNERLLERWRADPEHYQRLRRDLKAFYGLPRSRQTQMRALDQQLHATDSQTQARLWGTLERYNTWLAGLTESQRQQIATAPTTEARLDVIRQLRVRQWLPTLPLAIQEEVKRLPVAEQTQRIALYRAEFRQQAQQWEHDWYTSRNALPRPTQLDELPPEVRAHVEKNLLPRLTEFEKVRLTRAQGKYPEWLRVVQNLAEVHPVLPPLPKGEISTWQKLPQEAKHGLTSDKSKRPKGINKYANKWPEFALEITRQRRERKLPVVPLGASKPSEFPPIIQTFINQELLPMLSPERRAELHRLEGKWPEYPKQLLKLARDRSLIVPGMSLPGPIEMWEAARLAAVSEASDRQLDQIVHEELTPKERAAIKFHPGDPKQTREKVMRFLKQMSDEHNKRRRPPGRPGSR
jgi:hypothetical protein